MSCGFSTGTHPGQKHKTYFNFSVEQKNVRGLTWGHASLRKVRCNYVRGQSLWHQQCFSWVCTKWVSWIAFGATAEINQLVKGQKKQQPKQIISEVWGSTQWSWVSFDWRSEVIPASKCKHKRRPWTCAQVFILHRTENVLFLISSTKDLKRLGRKWFILAC